jgi:hypothetical protein
MCLVDKFVKFVNQFIMWDSKITNFRCDWILEGVERWGSQLYLVHVENFGKMQV